MNNLLAVRSSYSLLYGTTPIEHIVAQAATWQVKALGLTDRENLYGVHTFLAQAKAKQIKPLVGVEFLYRQGGFPSPSIFLFALTRRGFSLLCRLLSDLHANSDFNIVTALLRENNDLAVITTEADLLERLHTSVHHLYAGLTFNSLSAISTARRLNLPLVALADSVFLSPDEFEIHQVLRSIALGKTLGTLQSEECAAAAAYLRSPTEMQSLFASWSESFSGAAEIVTLCHFDTIFHGFVFPAYPKVDVATELRQRVLLGAEQRYGELSDAILARIDYELEIIIGKGFAAYFLIIADIVAMASRTCGRGSGAASIVSYALGLTNVDPLALKLYFERFLTPSRQDPPDIDIDFAWDERDEILRRVIEHFGVEYCARVANHNHFGFRSALRESAKAHGLADAEISQVQQRLRKKDYSFIEEEPLWQQVLTQAQVITNLPRSISLHCGGLVITPKPIKNYAPIEHSADGYPLLAWEKEGTEAAGLVKLDLLGNRSLAVVRDTLANLKEEGIEFDQTRWNPLDDEQTVDTLARGESMGVFYIESPAMRQLQKKSGKGDFDHIVIHSSLIRPASNAFINRYLQRLKGESWEPLHPRLEHILAETYGILCYQEDVSKVAIALAGFCEQEADALRKVISKKARGEKLSHYAHQFKQGCLKNGLTAERTAEIWAMMLSFDGYSFCKPHSASYAMLSFQSAFLRTHHGAAFMAAVLSNQGGYYTAQAYISEARRMNIQLSGPDVNSSRIRYYANQNTIIIGLMAISTLSLSSMEALVQEREQQGFFHSLEDFSRRVSLARDELIALVRSGACDALAPHLTRSEQARILLSQRLNRDLPLFQEESTLSTDNHKQIRSRSRQELQQEFETLGFLRSYHPLLLWNREIASLQRIKASDLKFHVGRYVTLIGWQITRKEVLTKGGQLMTFVSFEDESDLYESVIFPQVLHACYPLLLLEKPLIVKGKVKNDQGALLVELFSLALLG